MSPLERPSGWSANSARYPVARSFSTPRKVSSVYNRRQAPYPSSFKSSTSDPEFGRNRTSMGRVPTNRERVGQKGTCSRFWTSFKEFLPGTNENKAKKFNELLRPFVPHDGWKTCGYFPCTAAPRPQPRNQTPRRLPTATINPDVLWRNFQSTNDSQRPTNPPGRTKPTPQPRSDDWHWIQMPSSNDIRLDPYLQHRCNSPHPIAFDIAHGPDKITYNIPDTLPTLLDPAYMSRPATHPSVTYMRIESVADDPLPHFPWSIEVRNPRGITCGDVFQAITSRFLEYVAEHEYNKWTAHRKKLAARAYYARVTMPFDHVRSGVVTTLKDGLRRIDYVGDRVMFRGLEQACATMDGTWLMYFGNERSKGSCFGAA